MSRIIDLKNKPEEIHSSVKSVFWTAQRISNKRSIVVLAAVLLVIAILVLIFQKNLITTIFFAMLALVLMLNLKKGNRAQEAEINPLGIRLDNRLYGYKELNSFWIEYDPKLGIKELSIQTKKWYLPYLKVPIEDQNPVQLRLHLLEFLPEVEHKDSLVEILARKLGL